eukprot:11175307-Lingulodinium_polyedra.AAC.1
MAAKPLARPWRPAPPVVTWVVPAGSQMTPRVTVFLRGPPWSCQRFSSHFIGGSVRFKRVGLRGGLFGRRRSRA